LPARLGRDLTATALGAMVYSFALGITTVALPLLALHAGYSKAAVGFLTAASAASQTLARTGLGAVMRRVPDWVLVFAAGGFLTMSCSLVAISAAVVPFVCCEILQGAARACFWTGSQTHVVRGEGPSVGRLATVNFVSSIGLLLGPIAAGLTADYSLTTAMWVAAGVAGVGMLPPMLLDRLPPFQRVREARRGFLWRRHGVDVGCFAGVTAGAWRGMLTSYVPVALQHAGESPSLIGGLVSIANGASILGAVLVARIRERRLPPSYAAATVAAGVGTALAAFSAEAAALEGVVLAVSGLGAGALQTLGPAIATDAVHPQERGDAIAAAGAFRAGAMFLSPLGVGAVLGLVALSPAMAVVGGLVTLPAFLARRTAPRVAASVRKAA
jgi:MFS family permease